MADGTGQTETVPKSSAFLPRWEWDAGKYRAASRVADGALTNKEVAAEAGITERQLQKWKNHPPFASLVAAIAGEVGDAFRNEAVATKAGRLRILIDMHNKLLAVIEARAAAAILVQQRQGVGGDALQTPRAVWAAGEETGVVVTKETWGKTNSHEASVDNATLKSLLDIQDRIARELGQREDTINVRHSGRVDHVHRIPEGLHQFSNDELANLEVLAEKYEAARHKASG